MENIVLPKLILARIQKYWDKTVPTDYPASDVSFSLKFADAKVKEAVDTFEDALETEDAPIKPFVPEGDFVSSYAGTYEVEGKPGVYGLLSPERIEDESVDVIALHYNTETSAWEKVEDAKIVDHYVYGTLNSFSPIAIFTIKKDLEFIKTPGWKLKGSAFVGHGNKLSVFTGEDGKVYVQNDNSGTKFEVPINEVVYITGGSVDGKEDIDNISISAKNVYAPYMNLIAGSSSLKLDDMKDENGIVHPVKVGTGNIYVENSTIRFAEGSRGIVHQDTLNIHLVNTKVYSVGGGETFDPPTNKETNIMKKGESFTKLNLNSNQSLRECNIILDNCSALSDGTVIYGGCNCGYSYTETANLTINGGDFSNVWCVGGGSNGRTKNVNFTINGVKIGYAHTVNRGLIDNAVFNVDTERDSASDINMLAVAADPTDKSVTGTVDHVKFEAGKGKYNLYLGNKAAQALTKEDVANDVEYVKISRSATYTIPEADKAVLGDKFIVK